MRLLYQYLILFFMIATLHIVGPSPLVHAQEASKITPSEAANIARQATPDATVVGVKLAPNGTYTVTVRVGNSVERVTVDADSGAIR